MRCGSGEDVEEGVDAVHEENALLRNELRSLRARNNRLIDQLRQKSMQISRLETANTRLEAEVPHHQSHTSSHNQLAGF